MKRFALLLAFPLIIGAAPAPREVATFAGGCFWCMEGPFDSLPGVLSVTVGYAGGRMKNPRYEEVSGGGTGHRESVQIVFDPTKISYANLLDIFWHNIDPTDNEGQFCDKGSSYRTAIFYHDATQQRLAEQSKEAAQKKLGRAVYTEILPASEFWRAEEYHQHYYKKNPVRYHFYRFNCGRDQRLAALWGSAPAH